MDEYLGIVKLFAGPYAPQNWAFCNGALLNIRQNTALFSVIGTQYGGDGVNTFALPNLMGRVAVGAGSTTSIPSVIPSVTSGQSSGSILVTLQAANLPAHTHTPMVSSSGATTNNPAGKVAAVAAGALVSDESPVTVKDYGDPTNMVAGNPAGIGMTGNSQPISIVPPYLGMNYIICTNGLFPSRS